jgi:hypothetical protein
MAQRASVLDCGSPLPLWQEASICHADEALPHGSILSPRWGSSFTAQFPRLTPAHAVGYFLAALRA